MSLVTPSIGWLNRLNGEFVGQFLSLWRLWSSLSNPHLNLEEFFKRNCRHERLVPFREGVHIPPNGKKKIIFKNASGGICWLRNYPSYFQKISMIRNMITFTQHWGGWLCWKIKGPWRPRDDFWCCQTMRDFSLSYWFVVSLVQGCRLLLKSLGTKSDTVDGRNPAPPGISTTSTCAGFLPNSSEVNGCSFLAPTLHGLS